MLTPSAEDLAWGAGRVEGYRCPTCATTLRFPRYNHPEKLLETRTGEIGTAVPFVRELVLFLLLVSFLECRNCLCIESLSSWTADCTSSCNT